MTKAGAAKIAARRIGIPVEEYERRRADGERWCYFCRTFHKASEFARGQRQCRKTKRAQDRMTYSGPAKQRVFRRGRKGRPETCTAEAVRPLWERGLTRREIASALGCSYWAVTRVLTNPQRSRYSTRNGQAQSEYEAAERSSGNSLFSEGVLSLDAASPQGLSRISAIPGGVEPQSELLELEFAQRLRALVGDIDEHDVARMNEETLQWLRWKIAEEFGNPFLHRTEAAVGA